MKNILFLNTNWYNCCKNTGIFLKRGERMKRMYKRIAKLMSAILCMALIFTILPAIPASAATSLRGESIYQIMVDRFYDGDPTNNASSTGDHQ